MSVQIHPTAIVDPKAKLGSEVEVGPYSVIGPDVQLGDRCKVGPHAVIAGHTTLGDECSVFPFASIGAAPQDLKFRGEASTLTIGSRNMIREYVTLQPGTEKGRMATVIGDGNLFMVGAHVAHDCIVGSNNVFANNTSLAGHVTIGNRVVIGGLVGIHQFVRIGDMALLGAGSMVAQDLPPYCIGQGDRCVLRGINTIGLERAGISKDDVREIRRVYRQLFIGSGKMKEKLANLPSELTSRPLVAAMLRFISESERGICSIERGASAGDSEDSQ